MAALLRAYGTIHRVIRKESMAKRRLLVVLVVLCITWLVCCSVNSSIMGALSTLKKPTVTSISPSRTHQPEQRLTSFAFAVKIGRETFSERLPLQFQTFLPRIDNYIFISDHEGQLGETSIFDCYTSIYDDALNSILSTGSKPQLPLPQRPEREPGWERDAHKNLPGFKHLYDSFPDAEWYMMIDEDTYVFTQNLYDITSGLNSSDPVHMGWAMGFPPCGVNDKVLPEEHPNMYQGGSGILLSRGALNILYPHIDQCILKSWDCGCGDYRTALCLHDVGLTPDWPRHPYGYHVHDFGQGEQGWPSDPCIRPVTGHHMRGKHFQEAYRAELAAPHGHVTFADLYAAHHGGARDITERDIDYVTDMGLAGWGEVEDARECREMCLLEPECKAWTFEDETGECFLKYEGGMRWAGKEGYVSGMLGERYRCKEPMRFTTERWQFLRYDGEGNLI
ncbi:hypothetical protein YB2330_005992 [Saitoella coloradoensis]